MGEFHQWQVRNMFLFQIINHQSDPLHNRFKDVWLCGCSGVGWTDYSTACGLKCTDIPLLPSAGGYESPAKNKNITDRNAT